MSIAPVCSHGQAILLPCMQCRADTQLALAPRADACAQCGNTIEDHPEPKRAAVSGLRSKMNAAERASLSLQHGEPDALFLAREAGPELLEALMAAVSIFVGLVGEDCKDPRVTPMLDAMRAAIVKATDQT